MIDFSKNDLSQVKVGERVWDSRHGRAVVVELFRGYFNMKFDNDGYLTSRHYDGRIRGGDLFPSTFWNEIHFDIPERPKRKVKKVIKVWAAIDKDGGIRAVFTSEMDTKSTLAQAVGYERFEELSKEIEVFE